MFVDVTGVDVLCGPAVRDVFEGVMNVSVSIVREVANRKAMT